LHIWFLTISLNGWSRAKNSAVEKKIRKLLAVSV
jgi:hypothetical protein